MSKTMLRAMALFSWCASWLMPSVRPKPTLRQLWQALRDPEKEPFS